MPLPVGGVGGMHSVTLYGRCLTRFASDGFLASVAYSASEVLCSFLMLFSLEVASQAVNATLTISASMMPSVPSAWPQSLAVSLRAFLRCRWFAVTPTG